MSGVACVVELSLGLVEQVIEHINNRCPHAYLTPLLADSCRSTVGPQGWEPQQRVLTSVS